LSQFLERVIIVVVVVIVVGFTFSSILNLIWIVCFVNCMQCVREAALAARINNAAKEGCRVKGFIEVNKVAGNFHFAPGRTFVSSHGHHIHEFQPEQAAK
jgi:hypothetical protein